MEVSGQLLSESPVRPRAAVCEGVQRRQAFRVPMRMAVRVDAPMQMYCELIDMSVNGARLDRELPCTPGVRIRFSLEVPGYGARKPPDVELRAEVVRVEGGSTGVRFIELDHAQTRAVRDLVNERQRLILAALRANREGPGREAPSWYPG